MRRRAARASLVLAFLTFTPSAAADEITFAITGVSEPLLVNVRKHVEDFGIAGRVRVSAGQFDEISEEARRRTREALKPFGYYHPNVSTSIVSAGSERWRMNIRIDAGPPVRVKEATVELRGDGASQEDLLDWRKNWPLGAGAILD
ncbi:MAG: POTRA domain-containing protein, partial [Woeseiaceae bacterium]